MGRNKILPLATIALLSLCGTKSSEAQNSVELVGGNNGTVADTKFLVPIHGPVSLFSRNLPFIDYHGKLDDFGLVDLNYNFKNSGLFAELQYGTGMSPKPYVGGYYTRGNDKTSFLVSTVFTPIKPEAIIQTITTYRPKKNSKFFGQLETLTGADTSGYSWSLERARLGIEKGEYQYGIAANLNQSKGSKPSYNIGAFVKRRF